MTIRESAYHTTATSGMKTDALLKNLQSISSEDIVEMPADVLGITGRTVFERNVPAFTFPVHSEHSGHKQVYVDLRSYGSFDEVQQKWRMRYETGYQTAQLQGALSLAWMRGRQSSIQLSSDLPIQVYMSWISESIAKSLNLDGRSQYIVAILAGIFYLRNFTDKEWDKEDQMLVVNYLTRTLRYSDVGVNSSLVQEHSHISDVADFCKSCYEATQSVSLKNLNPSILFSVVSGALWGPSAAERLCVSLEYPPAFVTCLFQVIVDQSYRGKCGLSKIAQRGYLSKLAPEFVQVCLSNIDQTK